MQARADDPEQIVQRDPLALVHGQRMVGGLERDAAAAQPAEPRAFSLGSVTIELRVALEVPLAQRDPHAPHELLRRALDRQRETAADEAVLRALLLDAAEIGGEHRARAALVLGQPVVVDRRVEADVGQALVHLAEVTQRYRSGNPQAVAGAGSGWRARRTWAWTSFTTSCSS